MNGGMLERKRQIMVNCAQMQSFDWRVRKVGELWEDVMMLAKDVMMLAKDVKMLTKDGQEQLTQITQSCMLTP